MEFADKLDKGYTFNVIEGGKMTKDLAFDHFPKGCNRYSTAKNLSWPSENA